MEPVPGRKSVGATPRQSDVIPASWADIVLGRQVRQARASFRVMGAGAVFLTIAPWLSSPSSALGVSASGKAAISIERTVTATTGVSRPPAASAVLPSTPPSLVAVTTEAVSVYDSPDEASAEKVLDPADEESGQLVFLLRQDMGEWLEVYLPIRPNGSTGWLRRDRVEVSQHRYRIELSLSDRRLQVFQADEQLLDEPIGVGAEDTPTPGGIYYLKVLLRPPDPDGFYGPYAYGLSGFSDELFDYAGGTGVIGIHGTDDVSSVGQDVSKGCIRMANDVIVRLAEEIGLPLGTPVQINA